MAGYKHSKRTNGPEHKRAMTKPRQIQKSSERAKGRPEVKVEERKEFAGSAVQTTTTRLTAQKAKERVAKVERAPSLFPRHGTHGGRPHGQGQQPHSGDHFSQGLGKARERASLKEKAKARAAKAMSRWEARAVWAKTTT